MMLPLLLLLLASKGGAHAPSWPGVHHPPPRKPAPKAPADAAAHMPAAHAAPKPKLPFKPKVPKLHFP